MEPRNIIVMIKGSVRPRGERVGLVLLMDAHTLRNSHLTLLSVAPPARYEAWRI